LVGRLRRIVRTENADRHLISLSQNPARPVRHQSYFTLPDPRQRQNISRLNLATARFGVMGEGSVRINRRLD